MRLHFSVFVNYACVTVTVHQRWPWLMALARPCQRLCALYTLKAQFKVKNMFYYLEWAGHVAASLFLRLWRGMCAFVLTT